MKIARIFSLPLSFSLPSTLPKAHALAPVVRKGKPRRASYSLKLVIGNESSICSPIPSRHTRTGSKVGAFSPLSPLPSLDSAEDSFVKDADGSDEDFATDDFPTCITTESADGFSVKAPVARLEDCQSCESQVEHSMGQAKTKDIHARLVTLEAQMAAAEAKLTDMASKHADIESNQLDIESRIAALKSRLVALLPKVAAMKSKQMDIKSVLAIVTVSLILCILENFHSVKKKLSALDLEATTEVLP